MCPKVPRFDISTATSGVSSPIDSSVAGPAYDEAVDVVSLRLSDDDDAEEWNAGSASCRSDLKGSRMGRICLSALEGSRKEVSTVGDCDPKSKGGR